MSDSHRNHRPVDVSGTAQDASAASEPSPSEAASPSAYRAGGGDRGRTRLGGHAGDDTGADVGADIGKHDLRLTVYGDCEEASAAIGVATALAALPKDVVATLVSVQNDLADVTHDLARCGDDAGQDAGQDAGRDAGVDVEGSAEVRLSTGHVERLDRACAHYGAELERPDEFVLPSGTAAASTLFWARAVVRRAERSFWQLADRHQSANPVIGAYLNRLSTLLFLLARVANLEHGDTLWRPGLSVTTDERREVGTSA